MTVGSPFSYPTRTELLGPWDVLGELYTVEYVKGLRDEDGVKVDGLCCTTDKNIEIDAALNGEILLKTFLHEYLHAVLFEAGLEDIFGEKLEEVVIIQFEKQVFKVIATLLCN